MDYNGVLKSLNEALAQYALGDDDDGTGNGAEIVAPLEERVEALLDAIEETERHLRGLGFDPSRLVGSRGFARIQALADAVDAVYASDESKRRYEILTRQVFIRFKALAAERTAFVYAERHDNLEAIYKKLSERRDTADVTELLKELHRIVNEAIRAQPDESRAGEEEPEARFYDLSQIDLEKLRDEFARRVRRKAKAIQDIRQVVEEMLARMLAQNPQRMDFYRKYSEIVADYNREKDRVSIEDTFAKLMDLMASMDAEQRRAAEEGLNEEELALFDLLKKENLGKAERERVKQASRTLLESVRRLIAPLEQWTEKEQTQAEVEVFVLDHLFELLPNPPFTDDEKQSASRRVYQHLWQQSAGGRFAIEQIAA